MSDQIQKLPVPGRSEDRPEASVDVQEKYEALCRQLPIDCGEFKIGAIRCALTHIPAGYVLPPFGLGITMQDGTSGGIIRLRFGLTGIENIDFFYTPGVSAENDKEVIGKVRKYFSTQESMPLTSEMFALAHAVLVKDYENRQTPVNQGRQGVARHTEMEGILARVRRFFGNMLS